MKTLKFFLFISVMALMLQSQKCPVKYNLSGGRQFADSVTVSVMPFVNSAPLAKATITQTFADALRDALQKTTLKMVPKDGDLNYEGTITGYNITPVSIQAGGDNNASYNRLTITVNVKYTDAVDEKLNFDAPFSRYADYPSTQNLSSVEDQLIKDITDQIVQDVLNRSINAW
jgi:hypothetical protein